MRDFTQSEENLDLLRSVRHLLNEARDHSDVTARPLANFPLREALRDLDAILSPSDPFAIDLRGVPAAFESAWHAMRAAWTHSDVSAIPTLAVRFHDGIQRIENQLYGECWAQPPVEVVAEVGAGLEFR